MNFKLRRDNGKNSYERWAYESVDDGSPSWVTSQKWTENKIQAVKGLGGGISVSLIQASVKTPLRVSASLFCTYWLFSHMAWILNFKRQGYSPTLQDRLVQTLPHPRPPATFCTYWLASFFSWISSPYLFPPSYRLRV